jgi:tetratricopeptide (TPR) repeat protein
MKLWLRLTAASGIACLVLVLGGCATHNPEAITRADMQRRLADIKLSKGQYELAIREYKHSLEVYAGDPETYFGLAEAYRRKGLLDEAEATLLEALRLDPSHQEARLNLGVVLLQKEKWGEAISQNQILLDEPTFLRPSRALVNIGWAYYKSGDLERARISFVEAIGGDSTNLEAHLNLGIVLYQLGEVVEAIRYFQRAVEVAEKRPVPGSTGIAAESRFRMAQAHVKLGQLDRAIEHLRVAAENGGNGEWGRKSKEYLQVLE